jgi:hypothetical protein
LHNNENAQMRVNKYIFISSSLIITEVFISGD